MPEVKAMICTNDGLVSYMSLSLDRLKNNMVTGLYLSSEDQKAG